MASRVRIERAVHTEGRRRSLRLIPAYGALAVLAGLVCWRVLGPPTDALAAQVIAVDGHPTARDNPRAAWHSVSLETQLPRGSSLRTGESDRLDIQLPDSTRVFLDFDSEAELVRPKGGNQRPFGLRLRSGRVWLLVAESSQGLSVETPVGTAEALGTLFSVAVDQSSEAGRAQPKGPRPEPGASQATVVVLRGKVRVASTVGSETVSQGEQATVVAGRAPEGADSAGPLASLRVRAPWGQTGYEIWVAEPLRRERAGELLAGRRSWLGVDLVEGPSARAGHAVSVVEPGSPAAAAGLRLGDVIAQIGPIAINQRSDLTQAEFVLAPGDEVPVRVSRSGQDLVITVRLDQHPLMGGMTDGPPMLDRANGLVLRGKMEEAARLYEGLCARGEPAALNNLGVLRELEGRLREAYECYQGAALADPGIPLYHLNLGTAYSRIGNPARAAVELRRLAGTHRLPVRVRYAAGRALAVAGDIQDARSVADSLRAEPSTRASGCCLMGEISRLEGDANAASVFFAEAVEEDPYDPVPLIHLAALRFGDDNLQDARSYLDRALILDPYSLSGLNRLGLVLFREGQLDAALRTFQTASQHYPASAAVQNNVGMVYFRRDEMMAAAAAYRDGIRLSPDAAFCHVGLAMALAKTGDYEGAKREYATVIRLDPTYVDAYTSLAALHEKLGEIELAQAVAEQLRSYGL